jgi:peptide/nickel transport system substrate-binding protein
MGRVRLWAIALVGAALLLAATGCFHGGNGGGGGDGEAAPSEPGGEFDNYQLGIFEDTTTNNFWAYMDPESSVWNAYLLAPTKPAFFEVTMPIREGLQAGGTITPDLAAGEPAEPQEQDGKWVVEQQIQQGLTWSDGEPITARDFVFTVNTVHELELGGNWLAAFPKAGENQTGIESVEAVDDHTVRIVFNRQPGLAIWPHAVGIDGPWMPAHYWSEHVEQAKGAENPSQTLYGVDAAGDPSAGPVVFDAREEGAFARNRANEEWHAAEATVQLHENGGVSVGDETYGAEGDAGAVAEEYETGPFWNTQTFSLYGSQDAAVLALRQGRVDYLLNPLGMQRGLQDQVVGDENLRAVVNPTYGFRYLAFNMRKPPMNNKAFRQALATVIDRDFMAENVLQGVAFPLYTMMPEGNAAWYDEERANAIREEYTFEDAGERLNRAVELLKEGGFTWQTEPSYNEEEGFVEPGQQLRMPNGQPVPELEILAPPAGYDPLRATYAIWVERWAQELGIPARANPTGFNVIIDRVYTQVEFDMFILGWSLGNPAMPTFYESFWHSRHDTKETGGNNAPGFQNQQFDELADRFLAARDEEEAKEIVWQMEEILADELPYVVLFDTPILEFYRSASLHFPFEQTLGGLQFLNGLPDTVQAAR